MYRGSWKLKTRPFLLQEESTDIVMVTLIKPKKVPYGAWTVYSVLEQL